MAASPVMHRTAPAAAALFHATLFLADTLDWFRLWNWNEPTPYVQLDHCDHGGQHYIALDL